jgi:hypothetical protein
LSPGTIGASSVSFEERVSWQLPQQPALERIDFVEDALTGEIIDDWTITSESGADYAHPIGVPEPSGLARVAAAALPSLIRLRRNKAK